MAGAIMRFVAGDVHGWPGRGEEAESLLLRGLCELWFHPESDVESWAN